MDGKKHQVPDWQEIVSQLRKADRVNEAIEIETALQQGRKIKAIQLAKASGLVIPEG